MKEKLIISLYIIVSSCFVTYYRDLTLQEMCTIRKYEYYQRVENNVFVAGMESNQNMVWFIPQNGIIDTLNKKISIKGRVVLWHDKKIGVPFAKVSRMDSIDKRRNLILEEPITTSDSLGNIEITTSILGNKDKLYIYSLDKYILIPLCYDIGELYDNSSKPIDNNRNKN